MNNLEYITIKDHVWNDDNKMSFEVEPTDEMISIADRIREEKGFTDKATDINNDVWYNYYLEVNLKDETVEMWFTCNNGEKDDYAGYEIVMDELETKHFLWKAFKQYILEETV